MLLVSPVSQQKIKAANAKRERPVHHKWSSVSEMELGAASSVHERISQWEQRRPACMINYQCEMMDSTASSAVGDELLIDQLLAYQNNSFLYLPSVTTAQLFGEDKTEIQSEIDAPTIDKDSCTHPQVLFYSGDPRLHRAGSEAALRYVLLRQHVTGFYKRNNPSKLVDVEQIVAAYIGREQELRAAWQQKYGHSSLAMQPQPAKEPVRSEATFSAAKWLMSPAMLRSCLECPDESKDSSKSIMDMFFGLLATNGEHPKAATGICTKDQNRVECTAP